MTSRVPVPARTCRRGSGRWRCTEYMAPPPQSAMSSSSSPSRSCTAVGATSADIPGSSIASTDSLAPYAPTRTTNSCLCTPSRMYKMEQSGFAVMSEMRVSPWPASVKSVWRDAGHASPLRDTRVENVSTGAPLAYDTNTTPSCLHWTWAYGAGCGVCSV
eukprot:430847-Rhodomonas_salina.1